MSKRKTTGPKPYIKVVTINDRAFHATFTSGAETTSHAVTCFFQKLEDSGIKPEGIEDKIRIGEEVDCTMDWKEARRIAATFLKAPNYT
jgi:hypothetical protein